MKKTIIALLALGGVACGAGVTNEMETGNTTAAKSMMITSAITLSNLKTIVTTGSTNVTLLSIESGVSNSWGIGVGTWTNQKLVVTSAKGGETITDSNCTDLTWYNASGETVSAPFLNQIFTNLENAAGAAITLGYQTWKVTDDTTTTNDLLVYRSVNDSTGLQRIDGKLTRSTKSNGRWTRWKIPLALLACKSFATKSLTTASQRLA